MKICGEYGKSMMCNEDFVEEKRHHYYVHRKCNVGGNGHILFANSWCLGTKVVVESY